MVATGDVREKSNERQNHDPKNEKERWTEDNLDVAQMKSVLMEQRDF